MLVMAKCTARAFDNATAREYLPGIEYESDTESQLATLTVVPVAYDDNGNAVRSFRDAEGKLKTQRIPNNSNVFSWSATIVIRGFDIEAFSGLSTDGTSDPAQLVPAHAVVDHGYYAANVVLAPTVQLGITSPEGDND